MLVVLFFRLEHELVFKEAFHLSRNIQSETNVPELPSKNRADWSSVTVVGFYRGGSGFEFELDDLLS
jgi:hypothetical protein